MGVIRVLLTSPGMILQDSKDRILDWYIYHSIWLILYVKVDKYMSVPWIHNGQFHT